MVVASAPSPAPIRVEKRQRASVWSGAIVRQAIADSFGKLNPLTLYRNVIIFMVEIGAALTSGIFVRDVLTGRSFVLGRFELQISIWLWFTVLFANFAEAIAEGRGKAQADALRRTRAEAMAN